MKLYVVALNIFVFSLMTIWQASAVAQVDPAAPNTATAPASAADSASAPGSAPSTTTTEQATTPASAPAVALAPAAPASATAAPATPVDPERRLDDLVAVMRAAADGFGRSPDEQDKMEKDLRATADFCAKHRFAAPIGIDIGVTLDAGVFVGGLAGADLVFMFQDDGTLGVGLFPSLSAQLGVGAVAGGGFTVSLVFNMKTVNDYVGNAMGISGGISLGAGGGLTLNLGITTHDFAGLVETFKAQYHKDGSADVRDDLGEWLKSLVAPGRSYVVGLGASFGVGAAVNAADGWAFKAYEKSIAFDKNDLGDVTTEAADVHDKLTQLKGDALKAYLVRDDDARNEIDRAKNGFEEHRQADKERDDRLRQDFDNRFHQIDRHPQ